MTVKYNKTFAKGEEQKDVEFAAAVLGDQFVTEKQAY